MRPLAQRHLNRSLALYALHNLVDSAGLLPDVLFFDTDHEKLTELEGFSLLDEGDPGPLNWYVPRVPAATAELLWLRAVELYSRYPDRPDKGRAHVADPLSARFPQTAWFGRLNSPKTTWTDLLTSTLLMLSCSLGGALRLTNSNLEATTPDGVFQLRDSSNMRLPPEMPDRESFKVEGGGVVNDLAQAVKAHYPSDRLANQLLVALCLGSRPATITEFLEFSASMRAYTPRGWKTKKRRIRTKYSSEAQACGPARDLPDIDEVSAALAPPVVDLWGLRGMLCPSVLSLQEFRSLVGHHVRPGQTRKMRPDTRARWLQRIMGGAA